jgi:hypothetical protein
MGGRMSKVARDGDQTDVDLALADRAALAARAELRGDRTGILGAIGESSLAPLQRTRAVPERWSFLHVMERMEEGFRILARLPMPTRPKGYINSMPIYLYGLGGLVTSPGMLTLADKIKALGTDFIVLGPYDQDAWEQAANDLNKRPANELIAAVGYSLGANNVVEIAAELGRKIDYLAGIQPSYWGLGVDWSGVITLPPNVGVALNIYNPNFAATFGLGYARYAAPAGFAGSLRLVVNEDLHPDVDNDAGVHGLILRDLQNILRD